MGTVHFTIGEDFGELITNIAQEKITCEYDYPKAVRTIKESLVGMPEDMAIQILFGKSTIVVDVETQECVVHNIGNNLEIDVHKLVSDLYNRITKDGESIQMGMNVVINQLQYKEYLNVRVQPHNVFKYLIDNDVDGLLSDIDEEFFDYKEMVRVAKRFLETSAKKLKLINDLKTVFDIDVASPVVLMRISSQLRTLCNKIHVEEQSTDELDSYIKNVQQMDKTIKEGLKPVDILDNYSAGWLSPDGKTYYGLNGDIANMLHNNIADGLKDVGIIPEKEENPDHWLEKNGWVKQHGNWILMDLNTNRKGMTQKQVDTLYRFGQTCCDGRLKFGIKQELISAARFQMLTIEQVNKLFEY